MSRENQSLHSDETKKQCLPSDGNGRRSSGFLQKGPGHKFQRRTFMKRTLLQANNGNGNLLAFPIGNTSANCGKSPLLSLDIQSSLLRVCGVLGGNHSGVQIPKLRFTRRGHSS